MTKSKRALLAAAVLVGAGALFTGLWLLATIPLIAVLVILGAMACTLNSVARLLGEKYKPGNAEEQ